MSKTNGFEMMKRYATAARTIIDGGIVNAAEDRPSKTVFMSAVGSGSFEEACAVSAATEGGLGLVVLAFGHTGKSKGPGSLTAAIRAEAGPPLVFRDCALVETEDGRLIMVPRWAGAAGDIVLGEHGLEHRPETLWPLGPGMIRAARRLAEAAQRLQHVGPTVEFHMTAA